MLNESSLNVPVSVTKENGLFVATCKMFNIKVTGKTEFETKMNFGFALNEVICDSFKHMIMNKKAHAKRKEEESFSMAL